MLQPIDVLSMLNTNTIITKMFPTHINSFPPPLMGNESKKQHSPTKTNTNPYTTFTINTLQCINYNYTKMVPQNTSHGLEQNNKTNKTPNTVSNIKIRKVAPSNTQTQSESNIITSLSMKYKHVFIHTNLNSFKQKQTVTLNTHRK